MKTYIYRFADGTKRIVQVSDELHAFLEEEDRIEKFGNRRETRRHISLDKLRDKGIDPPVYDEYDYGEVLADLQNVELSEAVENLTAEQKNLLYSVFYERKKLKEIAREQKVTSAAICIRLRTTLSQLGIKR